MGLLAYLSNPKRLTLVSLLFLLIVVGLEVVGVQLVIQSLPPDIETLNARAMLTSLISFDGVFFGFSAIVFSSLVGRESTYERISYIFTAMIATVILFVLSVVFAFLGLASVEARGLSAGSFAQPLGFTVYGTTVFFFMIYIHVLRSRQAFK
jgi:uncharacterized integral membrane protein